LKEPRITADVTLKNYTLNQNIKALIREKRLNEISNRSNFN
jgi:hypothetical protein